MDRFAEKRKAIFEYIDKNPNTPFAVLNQMFRCDIRRLLKRHKPELYKEMVERGCGKKVALEKKEYYRKCLKCGRTILKPNWLCENCRESNKKIYYNPTKIYM